jgi:hypothetical protein
MRSPGPMVAHTGVCAAIKIGMSFRLKSRLVAIRLRVPGFVLTIPPVSLVSDPFGLGVISRKREMARVGSGNSLIVDFDQLLRQPLVSECARVKLSSDASERTMVKKFISAAAIGLLGLAAANFGSAQAAVRNLGAAVLAQPGDTNVIEAQARTSGKAAPRSAAPRRASPSQRAAPRRASPTRRAAPRRASPIRKAAPRRVAPRRTARTYRWSRDRRHRFYGSYFAVPFGFALYANHYCYDWVYGSRGWGYYWNYDRCPL